MNKKQAEELFKSTYMLDIRARETDGKKDIPMRRFYWGIFTDMLCRKGDITQKQYESWTFPAWLVPKKDAGF